MYTNMTPMVAAMANGPWKTTTPQYWKRDASGLYTMRFSVTTGVRQYWNGWTWADWPVPLSLVHQLALVVMS